MNYHQRKTPAHGVLRLPDRTTIVFVTVDTENRLPWLACDKMHQLLRKIWFAATGWLVGPYTIMPDHTHFFSTPGHMDCSLERWEHYWKHKFARQLPIGHPRLQVDHWDTRMRDGEHFSEKLAYMRQNPVRKGLVERAEDWPYQGVIHEWIYMGP